MRRFLTLFTLFLLSACGSDPAASPCAGAHTGEWTGNTQADAITFGADCSFKYTGVGAACTSTGTYPAAPSGTGSMLVTISNVSGSGSCLPAGDTTCQYIYTEGHLAFDCGGGALGYTKP